MLFFINPITTLVDSLSQEKALVRAYLGLSKAITKQPITNSVGEFSFYYSRFLGYIIHHLEENIAEIEAEIEAEGKANATAPTEEAKALPISEVEPTSPETKSEAVVVEQTQPSEIVEAIETEDDEDWPIPENPEPATDKLFSEIKTDSLKDRMLGCKCKQELEQFKAEIGEFKAIELWESLDILERNHIKSINLSTNPDKAPAPIGYLYQHTGDSKTKHQARLIGHYLHSEPLKDNERAILIRGERKPIVVKKSSLKPYVKKDQKPMDEGELEQLQNFLTQPQQQDDDEPDAATNATLNFKGLSEVPKLQNGSESGSQSASQASNVVEQPELPLTVEHSEPKEIPATPTPALEAIATELHKSNPQSVATLKFKYEIIEDSIFLTILHSDSEVAVFEDNGNDVYAVGNNKKLTFHGFTKTQIDTAFQAGEAVYEQQLKKA